MEALLAAHFAAPEQKRGGAGRTQASPAGPPPPRAQPPALHHPARQYTSYPEFARLRRLGGVAAAAEELRGGDVAARLYFELHLDEPEAPLSSDDESNA